MMHGTVGFRGSMAENNGNNNIAGDDKNRKLVNNVTPARNFPCMCYEDTFWIAGLCAHTNTGVISERRLKN
jgi:hypothetical protein